MTSTTEEDSQVNKRDIRSSRLIMVTEVGGGLKVTMRTAQQHDVESIQAMVLEDGWIEDSVEYELMFRCDPQSWLVAEEAVTGQVIGHCCGLKAGTAVAGLHSYIVDPNYRGHGVGSLLLKTWVKMFQERSLILSAIDSKIPMYSSLNVQPLYKWEVLTGSINKKMLPKTCSDTISISISLPDASSLQDFDGKISFVNRTNLVHLWKTYEKARTVVAHDKNSSCVLGYGVMFNAGSKWHVSPLYAESGNVAWVIASCLLKVVADGSQVVTWTPVGNQEACSVWRNLGLECHTVYNLMVSGNKPDVPLQKIYSMFSTATFGYA